MLDFEKFKEQVRAHQGSCVLYFFGDADATGSSWCPDCRNADGLIREKAEAAGAVLVEVPVGTREEWKNGVNNPYKNLLSSSPEFVGVNNISKIPTLVMLKEGKEVSRLVEDECSKAEGKLLSSFFAS